MREGREAGWKRWMRYTEQRECGKREDNVRGEIKRKLSREVENLAVCCAKKGLADFGLGGERPVSGVFVDEANRPVKGQRAI